MKFFYMILRTFRSLFTNNNLVGMVSPAPPGSLGDEALICGFTALLQRNEKFFQEILVYPNTTPCDSDARISKVVNYVNDGRKSDLLVALNLIRYGHLYIIGADTVDGGYNASKNIAWVNLANIASDIGVPVSFISFSFSKTPASNVVNALRNSRPNIRFCARDPFSKQRFEEFTSKKATQVADLAFSMVPYSDTRHINDFKDWIRKEKEEGNVVIGININTLPLSAGVKETAEIFSSALQQIFTDHQKVSIALLPHDFRENQSDETVLALLEASVNEPNRVRLLRGPFKAAEIKSVVKEIDLLVSGRMHLAIAALSQGVPTYCFTYKDKFEGLMTILDLKNNLFDNATISDGESVKKVFEFALEDFKTQAILIESQLPAVKELSSLNVASEIR
ncbi:MAG: polysaccharide pyruvyl transferase family protein [Pseudomonadota bacterium]|nr:polysaccharide pyruvyl transferase family protein [Pseudomonadota bacterium]